MAGSQDITEGNQRHSARLVTQTGGRIASKHRGPGVEFFTSRNPDPYLRRSGITSDGLLARTGQSRIYLAEG